MVSLFLKIVANDSDSTVDFYVGLDIHRAIFYIPVPCHVFWMAESAQGCQCLLSIDSVGFFCKMYPMWVLLQGFIHRNWYKRPFFVTHPLSSLMEVEKVEFISSPQACA